MKDTLIFVGIDVSKAQLDVEFRPTGEKESVANDKAGIKALVKRLAKLQPTLIVLEATGGYERKVAQALVRAELPVVVVNPRQVRDFAKATGKLAKTDRIDAGVLAHFGEAVRPQLRSLPDEVTLELRALTARRRQVIEMITAETNRLTMTSKAVGKRIDAHICWLEKELQRADQDLDRSIQQSPIWKENQELHQHTRHWSGQQPDLDRGAARARNSQSQTDLGSGGAGPLQSRQRLAQRSSRDLGRQSPST